MIRCLAVGALLCGAMLLLGGAAVDSASGSTAPECTCVLPVDEAGEPLTFLAQVRREPVAMVATALWEDRVELDGGGRRLQRVTLLPEASWGVSLADTVTMIVRTACAVYRPGSQYLVAGAMQDGALVARGCGPAFSLDHWSAGLLVPKLGRPTWRADGLRDLAVAGLVPPERPPPDGEDPVQVSMWGFHRDIGSVEIAGDVWMPGSGQETVWLPPGIYAGRVTWNGGGTSTMYLGVRCEGAPGPCRAQRWMGGLGIPPPRPRAPDGGSANTQLPVTLRGRIVNTTTGRPVEHASVRVIGSSLGARANREGEFVVFGVEDVPPIRLVVAHPCFHTVQVELERGHHTPLHVGLPFREPSGPAGEPVPGACSTYRPAGR